MPLFAGLTIQLQIIIFLLLRGGANETKYSKMGQVKFVEDSL